MSGLVVERTGNSYGINSAEYKITFPDNSSTLIWSPVWNELSDEEEDAGALEYAVELWALYEKHPEYNREIKTRYEGGELIIPDVVE